MWETAIYLLKAFRKGPEEARKMNGLRYTTEQKTIGALLVSCGELSYAKISQAVPVPAMSTSVLCRGHVQEALGFDVQIFDGSLEHVEAIINQGWRTTNPLVVVSSDCKAPTVYIGVSRDGTVVGVRDFRKLTREDTDEVFRDPRRLKDVKDEAKSLCYRGLNAIMISSAGVHQRPLLIAVHNEVTTSVTTAMTIQKKKVIDIIKNLRSCDGSLRFQYCGQSLDGEVHNMAEVTQLVNDFMVVLRERPTEALSMALTQVRFRGDIVFQDEFHNQKCGRNRCARKATKTALLPHLSSVVDLRALLLKIGMLECTLDPSNRMDDENPLAIVRGSYAMNVVSLGHHPLSIVLVPFILDHRARLDDDIPHITRLNYKTRLFGMMILLRIWCW